MLQYIHQRQNTSAPTLHSYSCKSFITVQLSCWRSGEFQQPARTHLLPYLSMHLYSHLPGSEPPFRPQRTKSPKTLSDFPLHQPFLLGLKPYLLPMRRRSIHSRSSMQLHSAIIRTVSFTRDQIPQYIQKRPPCILCNNNGELPVARTIEGYKINSNNRLCSH